MFHKKIRQPLENTLKDLKGFNIKLGSNTNFFYCGKCDNNIFATITKIDNEYKKWYEKALAKAKEKYSELDNVYNAKIEKVKRQYPKNIKKQKERIAKLEKARERERVNLPKRIGTFHHYLYYWKPFLERNVLYVIDSIDEKKCKVIKIVGNEIGKYWTIDEYKEKHKPKKSKVDPLIAKRNHEIYKMAISGKYIIKEILVKYDITYPTYKKIIDKERKIIREKYEKKIVDSGKHKV